MNMGTWIAIGTGVGVAMGVATDELSTWVAVGVGIGVALGATTFLRNTDN